MRRIAAIIATAALALFMAGFAAAPQAAHAAPYAQCDSVFNTPGLGMDCTVDVVNNLDLATGDTSSVTTYTQCSGSANTALTCALPVIVNSTDLVTEVSQCNSSLDGGGASMHCSVQITNNVTGTATAVPATINQCNDSLDGGGVLLRACTPDPASTSGATIDQCNNSVNGGGGSLTCIVTAGSTTSVALDVTVSQCNYSANGGGALVVCSTGMTTNILPAVVVPPVVVAPVVPPAAPGAVLPGASPDELAATGPESGEIAALSGALLLAMGLLLFAYRRFAQGRLTDAG